QGHAAMGFSVAGANEHINAGTAWRLAGDPPGTLQTPVLYTSSTAAYNPPGDPGGAGGRRWGDFSYTSLDPNDDMTLWTIQEFCDSLNSYGVRVARLLAPPPAIPFGCDPSSVPAGSSNVDLVVSGLSVGGAGFFDPGPGFPDRIAALVNGGGVTVNHVTYNDPVHLTLNVTVIPGATNGSRTITVTNPDGQSATSSSGLLGIVGGGTTNTPPTIAITSPTNNTAFTAPANISVTANASDNDGIVNKVEFFGGAISLGESTNAPYSLVWSNVAAGSYTLTATATDNIGAVTISDPVTISVVQTVPGAVSLVNVTADVSQAHFSFQTQSGVGYTVQFTDSLDPVAWQTLSVLNGNGSITNITDTSLAGAERFYRVIAK
ncbi:MAG TPA: Ig-like domain-containing protein, partial [Candidatus Angelobacter sp.]|nr:Ig-like domain-containing protein [Candidatus Angelobacter sp.]